MNVDEYRYRMEMDVARARWREWWGEVRMIFWTLFALAAVGVGMYLLVERYWL